MESTFSATFWWTLWIYICCKIKSAKRAVFAVLGYAEVNEEELKRESSFGSKVCWIRDLWQLWVTTLTATASWLQTTFRSDGWEAILNQRVWTPSHLTSESAGEEFKSSQDTCANDGWKNSYHRSDQDREGRNNNLRVGDVVVVIDPGTVRWQWDVGRIEQTYPGADGLVRVVDVYGLMARL